ncbi:hypothetical protein JXM83_04090 [Candidatus Woesearchaeota archaeon]|nr:hypothetical protein [Candidatus Woesearchaeota archaeon]
MANIRKIDLFEIVEGKLYSAGKEMLNLALKKLELDVNDELTPEEAISTLILIKEGMHTEISKKTVDKCIELVGKEILK